MAEFPYFLTMRFLLTVLLLFSMAFSQFGKVAVTVDDRILRETERQKVSSIRDEVNRFFSGRIWDEQFQGFGRSITDRNGHFFFRTIIPVEYPGRTPHIHLKLWNERENVLTTQLYIQGHSLNKEDFLFKRMTLAEQKINSMKLLPAQTNDSTEYITSVRLFVF